MFKRLTLVVIIIAVAIAVLMVMLKREKERAQQEGGNGGLQVVSTTTMVTDMVKVIGGERINLMGMMAAKVDPHSYQVTFSDTAALKNAGYSRETR